MEPFFFTEPLKVQKCDKFWEKHSNQFGGYYRVIPEAEETMFQKRCSYRLSVRNFAIACDLSRFKTSDELADEIAKICKPTFDDVSKQRMAYGREMEAVAIDWYRHTICPEVAEPFTAISLIQQHISGKNDSFVSADGLLEIKATDKLPEKLVHCPYMENMYPEHLYQCMGYCWLYQKNWCDFLYFKSPEERCLVRVLFDPVFFGEKIWPNVQNFIYGKLVPRLLQRRVKPSFYDQLHQWSATP